MPAGNRTSDALDCRAVQGPPLTAPAARRSSQPWNGDDTDTYADDSRSASTDAPFATSRPAREHELLADRNIRLAALAGRGIDDFIRCVETARRY